MRSGREATLKIAPEIKGISKNLSKYDCIIIGTPIWAYTVCGPVRAFIKKYSKDIHKTAFFCTMGGSGDAKTLKDMEKLSGKKPVAVLSLKTTDVKKKSPESVKNIKLFTKSIKSL
jgi:multimeric flavodoxin WrbA